jgi:penicillin-binding protein-related factor A (putative recombinase)
VREEWTAEQYKEWLDRNPDQKKVVQGRRAKAHGDDFERRLDHYHARCLALGTLISAARCYIPTRPVFSGNRLVWVSTGEKASCDYSVIFRNNIGGRFDAKSNENGKSFSWPIDQIHQLTELRTLHRESDGRCPAFALVEWKAAQVVCIHPIWTIADRSVRLADGAPVAGIEWVQAAWELWPGTKGSR